MASRVRTSLDEPWRVLMRLGQQSWAVPDLDFNLNRSDSDSSLEGYGGPAETDDKLIFGRVESHVPTPKGSGSLCVICMSSPSTIAFLHGTSLHTCCCEQCARQYAEACQDPEGLKCPYCRQPSEGVYTNYTV